MTTKPNLGVLRQNQLLWAATTLAFVLGGIIGGLSANITLVVICATGAVGGATGFFRSWRLSVELSEAFEQYATETRQLQDATERANAVYRLSTTLSSTLNYEKLLEAVQNLGLLALRRPDPKIRLVSVAFLYRNDDHRLHVANSRRLTLADEKKTLDGNAGIVAKALNKGEPVFGGRAEDDPELRYFVGFNEVLSLVAVPLRAGYQNYGALVFGSPEVDGFSEGSAELLSALSTQTTIALQNAVLYESIISEKDRIVQVEEDARKKLARDLHDGPTQTVSVIKMRIDLINGMVRSGKLEQAQKELNKVGDLAIKTTKEIRHLLFSLRPLVLENQGLIAALHEMVKKMKDTYDQTVIVRAKREMDDLLDEGAKGSLFYVIEEAVNNARKHAQAQRITVRLFQRQSYVITEIEDNGIGFDLKEIRTDYHKRGSLGMISMRERAELIDGEVDIQSQVGRGTKITIKIPISEDSNPSTQRPSKTLLEPSATRFHVPSGEEAEQQRKRGTGEPGWQELLDEE